MFLASLAKGLPRWIKNKQQQRKSRKYLAHLFKTVKEGRIRFEDPHAGLRLLDRLRPGNDQR